ncbi:alpha/beta hydrolase family protein [Streptomyces sp. NPDC002588]|uniref:alpha/beta hydrolase n=1 Tax=Streptomyces sp. NPDC002588 TaxID=3154419 RepID=UPI00333072A8
MKFFVVCFWLVAALLSSEASATEQRVDGPPRPVGAEARVTAERKIDDRMLDLTVRSPAMGMSIPVRVILPKNWRKDSRSTFPVLYMLHGGNDDYTSWTRETDVEALSRNSDVLIVMPDAGKAGYYSDWFASTPRWETFHTAELVRLMERKFHAGRSRAVVGLSMGGFGALNYAAHHQRMFRYVAAMSSYVDLNDPGVRLALALGSQRDGVDIRKVWGDPVADADVWQAHNPAAMPRAFRGTHVHLSSGDSTLGPLDQGRSLDVMMASVLGEAVLPKQNAKFASSLRSAGVAVSMHLYRPGTHSWPYWQNELHHIWPAVLKSLEPSTRADAGSGR